MTEPQILYQRERTTAAQGEFIRRVYNWMGLGLALTALVALYTASNHALLSYILGNSLIFFGLIIGQLALVIVLSAAINRFQASTAFLLFFVYSALTGLTLSVIFLAYTRASIASTFFVTAGTFAVMSFYGYTTQRDLTSWGSFLFMGLVGIILASVVNIFLHNETVYWVVTYAGILIFVGLTAYDTQTLKAMAQAGFADEEVERKSAVMGALRLYLDFINLFLMLLRVMGNRR
ncbi:MAG: Bax inhibitor-1/YccA family protein [Syntrophobacterales bacterium]|jgi:FtsH-binding integral membrane protein